MITHVSLVVDVFDMFRKLFSDVFDVFTVFVSCGPKTTFRSHKHIAFTDFTSLNDELFFVFLII
ncbi:hypothetical protein NBO_238g0001 [Nosema bombycis CQ1]|uniref:Uncharacterized protein n=1 Tax=Nosema bombycis (strain CQ1 / CVCC 102059) TaxID=578461 RepID=R0MJS0_NOSB1|nr:hypothetical protein NBO_238g0001 [Nosema bombycis CQ1]|eukprot:EOB13038.1 hypothetical protein NBO_238g0001 [Nosema bombycis CQ1]